jgi:hypothetical protein
MDQQSIKVDVLLTLQDYLRANYWFLFKRNKSMKAMIFMLIFAGTAGPLYLVFNDKPVNPNESYWGLLIPWAILLFMIGVTYWGTKRQMASSKSMNESHQYTFTTEGIEFVAQSSSGRQSWENIREAFETKSNFLLFISLNQIFIVPKRCFQDSEYINQFKDLLKSRLGSKAKIK